MIGLRHAIIFDHACHFVRGVIIIKPADEIQISIHGERDTATSEHPRVNHECLSRSNSRSS
jgi:hypothetical protein